MSGTNFIGTGHNPEGPDLPLGLGMQLAQNPKAMDAFGSMTNAQKAAMIGYIQGAATGGEAKERIADAVYRLHNNRIQF